jgi:rhodanese-related sulfurtransferase
VPAAQDPAATIVQISPQEMKARIEGGEPVGLLDVREPWERAFCSIKVRETSSDLHIPMREIPTRLEQIKAVVARGPLVVYCHHGVRSMAVAAWLAERGLTGIMNLSGGIDAWSLETDPSVPRYH